MIYKITEPSISNILGQNPKQNQNSYVASVSEKSSTIGGGRVIHDKIDLSVEAYDQIGQRNSERKKEQEVLTNEILQKGFRGWAQEMHKEKIEAEVRAQVLSSMGLDEDDFSRLESDVQQRIQEIIEAKAREKLEEKLSNDMKKTNTNETTPL